MAKLFITGETADIYPPPSEKLTKEESTREFEKRLRELKNENPDSLLVESGRFYSVHNALETPYRIEPIRFHLEMDFNVVNLAARDAALGTVVAVGYHRGWPGVTDPVISGLESQHPKPVDGITPSIDVDRDGAPPMTFVGLPSLKTIQGLSGKMAELAPFEGVLSPSKIIERQKRKGRLTVGISEMDEEELARALETAKPELLIDHTGISGRVEPWEDGWRVGAPDPGEILELDIERQGGILREPKARIHTYLEPSRLQDLYVYPTPELGMQIPNIDSAVERHLDRKPESIFMDSVPREEEWEDLTSLDTIYVYHVRFDDGDYWRIYRIWGRFKAQWEGEPDISGLPSTDMLVVVDAKDGSLVRLVNRPNFPLGLLATSIREGLNRLAGTDPETWQPEPKTSAGVEEVWWWIASDMKKTLQLDELIYGEEGLLATGAAKQSNE